MNGTPFRFSDRQFSTLGKLLRKVFLYSALAVSFALTSAAYGQMNIEDLVKVLNAGDVEILSLTGNGGSSGPVLEGYLLNQSSISRNLDVRLGTPLYFENKGAGQNMIATQIYERDLSYMSDGENSFISLKSNERLSIMLIAYCVDFYKENPSGDDSFVITGLPSDLIAIAKKISAYEGANPSKDVTLSAQLALWKVQGISLKEIRERFPFDSADQMEMHAILRASE